MSQANSPSYAAPELFNFHPNTKSDVWAAATICWEVLTLRIPWTDQNLYLVGGRVLGGETLNLDMVPKQIHEHAPLVIDLLRRCFSWEPAARPTATEFRSILEAAAASVRLLQLHEPLHDPPKLFDPNSPGSLVRFSQEVNTSDEHTRSQVPGARQ